MISQDVDACLQPTGDAVKDNELDAACGKGPLFIDELSRASAQVLKRGPSPGERASFQRVQTRFWLGHHLRF